METVKEDELLLPSQRDREWVADYAVRRDMPKWTVQKYLKGNGDKEQLVQLVTRVRVEIQAESAQAIQDRDAKIASQNTMIVDLQQKLSRLETQNANQASNISNVCSQLDSVKADNTAKKEEISFLNKVLLAVKTRAQGSIFGKGKDIVKLVDDGIYIPGE